VYQINAYSTGAKQAQIKAKTAGIDRGTLPNLESAYFQTRVDAIEKAAARTAERTAHRDPKVTEWRKKVETERSMTAAMERGKARGRAAWNTSRDRVAAGASRIASGVGSFAASFLGGFASEIENMALTPEQKAERKAEDQARREAAPSAKELRDHEHKVAVERDQNQKSSERQDPKAKYYADVAKQFAAAEQEQDGGRSISRGGGGGGSGSSQ
jgi:hypothetical protein